MTFCRRLYRTLLVFGLTALAAALLPVGTSPAVAGPVPPGRLLPAMATDPATGNVVLFGGLGPIDPQNDTWLWDGQSWTEVQPTLRPPAREGATMAADVATGTVVMFGGRQGSLLLSDTWVWDGISRSWTPQTTVTSPSPRTGASMAADPADNGVVLFGGGALDGTALDDTWSWNGATKTWMQRTPTVKPTGRAYASMASDSATSKVVLFGGRDRENHGAWLGGTWTWDGVGGTWTEQFPSVNPRARAMAYMADQSVVRRVVLFGGDSAGQTMNDTWSWNGTKRTWTKEAPANSPCPRKSGAMAYHPGTKTALIFGGKGSLPCGGLVQDTFGWNGVNWKQRA